MSSYADYQTEYSDQSLLLAALAEMGLNPQVHSTPQDMRDYHGNVSQAEIIVTREEWRRVTGCHCWGGVGFARQPNGTYTMIADDLDARKPQVMGVQKTLRNLYAEKRIIQTGKRQGLAYAGKTVRANGKIDYKFVKAGR